MTGTIIQCSKCGDQAVTLNGRTCIRLRPYSKKCGGTISKTTYEYRDYHIRIKEGLPEEVGWYFVKWKSNDNDQKPLFRLLHVWFNPDTTEKYWVGMPYNLQPMEFTERIVGYGEIPDINPQCMLTIHSNNDANAECACGWRFVRTGYASFEEIKEVYDQHLKTPIK